MTMSRAQRLLGELPRDGMDRMVAWKASKADRRSHPGLPGEACVQGRFIVRRVQPDNGGKAFLLALFTTLPGSPQQILELYGERWTIETDLRTLKSTLSMQQLTCSTADMVAKEINMGIAAYNLVRTLAYLASQQSGIPSRGFSFTKVQRILHTFGPALAAAPNAQAARQIFDRIMRCVLQSKLYRRKRRAYPRHVLKRRDSYPTRKT
jgi:hypothetical protein